MSFETREFSQIALAIEELRTVFQSGETLAERPPREGASGAYFFRGCDGDVLAVFKPVDEEHTFQPVAVSKPLRPSGKSSLDDFYLGSAHDFSSSPVSPSPHGLISVTHPARNPDSAYTHDSYATSSSGFYTGEGAYKEVAAYLLDHGRFSGVPQTALAICKFSSDVLKKNDIKIVKNIRAHPIMMNGGDEESEYVAVEKSTMDSLHPPHSRLTTKMGSLQVFMKNEGDADDFGPGVFDKENVQRIAILDIRTLNHDRHGGNILVTKSTSPIRRYNLVPIDHGLILPVTVHSIPWAVWMDWPQVREPLSDRLRNYIDHLDAESEAHILHKELDGMLLPGSLQGLKIATMLLQKGVAAGLTLYDIGLMMYSRGDNPHHVSELTKIICEAEEANVARERNFSETELMMYPPPPLSPEGHHHRRHQSMPTLHVPEMFIYDYIIKCAERRLQDVVALAAAKKMSDE